MALQYMLGFLEYPENATPLLRHRFPSKVGGVPVSPAGGCGQLLVLSEKSANNDLNIVIERPRVPWTASQARF
jgi:hypothetical protein